MHTIYEPGKNVYRVVNVKGEAKTLVALMEGQNPVVIGLVIQKAELDNYGKVGVTFFTKCTMNQEKNFRRRWTFLRHCFDSRHI